MATSNEDRIPVVPEFLNIADKIEQSGKWIQRYWEKDGYRCAAGWIGEETGVPASDSHGPWKTALHIEYYRLYSLFNNFLEKTVGRSIEAWNDHSERTQEEVVEKFREAAYYGDFDS